MEESLLINKFQQKIEEVKIIIRKNMKDSNSSVCRLMDNLPAEEGKLIRAVFVLIGGAFGSIEEKRLMEIAAGIELLHLATLVHDDIVDETELRRGKRALHTLYNTKSALFAGDYLFSHANVMFSKSCSPHSIMNVSETIKSICKSEISQYFSLYSINTSVRSYLKRIKGKCADLFSLSMSIGAYEAGADKDTVRKLRNIGYYTGMAFQLIDDLLDMTSTDEVLGKPASNDIRQGIYNLPIVYELRRGNEELSKLLKEHQQGLILNLVKNSEGFLKAKETAGRYTHKALNLVDELPDIEEKKILRKVVDKLLVRSY